MRWFADTFNNQSFSRAQVADALAGSITDVIQAISDKLTHTVRGRLNHTTNPLEKVQILFGHLDTQVGNAGLLHTFQQAALQWGGIDHMLHRQLLVNSLPASDLDVSPHGSMLFQQEGDDGEQRFIQSEAPFLRNCPPPSPFFQGRHDVLSQLNSWFQPTEKKDQKVVLLYGLGGAGKTQIALKFIADSGSRFTDQCKIDASSKETIEAGYKQIAVDKKLGNTADAARTWLKANRDEWLLLFDNADNHDLHLGDHLPKCSHGNILITSRNPGLSVYTGRQKKIIEISNLLLNDAATLLLTRAGLEHEDHYNKTQAVIIAKVSLLVERVDEKCASATRGVAL
ncbi:P-loop containing nucleoside triphosphate hydrolase protein [Mycena amicta]|nr:P-loop containing nucleoside triphosphate hydrolase protein [Mycena amicta]